MHFDFVSTACENRRAATGTEKPAGIVACLALDRHRLLGEHCGRIEERPMMLAAIETVTQADPVWAPRCHEPDITTKAAASESVHAAPPLRSSDQMVTTNRPVIATIPEGGPKTDSRFCRFPCLAAFSYVEKSAGLSKGASNRSVPCCLKPDPAADVLARSSSCRDRPAVYGCRLVLRRRYSLLDMKSPSPAGSALATSVIGT